MGHQVRAVIAPALALRGMACAKGLDRPCPLPAGWALLPLTDETLDQLCPQGTGSPLAPGFSHLGPDLLALLLQALPGGAVYFETDHFGGSGSQCALAVRDGRAIHAPAAGSGAINAALRALDFATQGGLDAFDTLDLGRHRHTSDWADAAAELGAGAHFTVHWSRVPNPPADALPGVQVHALWPSPVNADACFESAGFADFGDADDDWDAHANALLQQLLNLLSTHFGDASQPPPAPGPGPELPWYRRFFAPPAPRWRSPLEQLTDAMHDDNLPLADIRFGQGGARVRASAGHWLLWVDWPSDAPLPFEALVQALAEGRPVHRTELDWRALWPGSALRAH